ncbi:MAG: tail fiber domain-containing protein [Romboutsia timonensis]
MLAIGSRGILIADELNPDNSWNWKTAISAKGLSTELVSTIQLVAEQIIAGTLASADNSTWINLDTGEFNFKDKIKFVDGNYTIDLGDDVLTRTEYEQDKNSIIASVDIEQLGNWLLDFQKEKEGLYEQYLPLYEDTTNLSTAERNDLKQSWDEYEYEYNVIVDLINNIIDDGVVTTEEKEQYDTEVGIYTQKYKSLIADLQRYWNLCNVHYTNTQISVTQSNIMTSIEGVYIKKTELDNSIYYSLSLSNEYQGIPIDADGFPTEDVSFETRLSVYKGSQLMNIYTINAIASSDGITATIDDVNKKITFTKPKTEKFTLTGGTLRISITIEGIDLYKDLTWSTISPGKDGNEGTPGINSYLHIMYAPNGNPTADEMTKIPDAYMGVYTDNIETDSTDPTKYKWSKIKGEDGTSVNIKDTLQSEADLPITATSGDGYLIGNDLWIMTDAGTWTKVENFKGQDGKSRYVHIKYSDDGGITFTANGGETTGKYMGVYVDDIELDSTDVLSYTWTQIMGDNGLSSYFHVKYAPNNNPTADEMSEYPKEYIGTYVDNIEADSNDPTKYTWVKLEGKDGIAGKDGLNGTTYYLHIKYSNDEGQTFTDNEGEDVGKYIGTLVDTVEEDSLDPTDYTWAKMQGDDGAVCKIEFNSNTFNSTDDGKSYSPESITLNPTFSNCEFLRWYYKTSTNSTWVVINTSTAGLTYNETTHTIQINYSSSLFNEYNREVTFKLTTSNDAVFDIVTITKLTTLEDTLSQIEVISNTVFNQNIDSFRTEVSDTYLKADDASELYSTKTELIQTSTRFEFLFEGSANGNLIINGCPNVNTLHVGWLSTANVVGTDEDVYIDTYNSSAYSGFISNRFEIKTNNTYTFSFKYKAMSNIGKVVAYAKIYNVNTGGVPIYSYTLGELKNDNVWNQFIQSVTPTQVSDALYMSLCLTVTTLASSDANRNVYIKECMCLLGDTVPEQYVPSNYELIKGKTIITGDGIEVLSGAISIKNDAGITVWSADDDGNMVMRNGNFYIESSEGYEIASINQNNWMRIQGIHIFGNGECMRNTGSGARSFQLDSTTGNTCYIDFNRGLPEETEPYGCRIARLDNTKSLTMYANSITMQPTSADSTMGLELRSRGGTCYMDFSTDLDADYRSRIFVTTSDGNLHIGTNMVVKRNGGVATGEQQIMRTHGGTNIVTIDSIGLNTVDKCLQIGLMSSTNVWYVTTWLSDVSLKKNIIELENNEFNLLNTEDDNDKLIGLELIKNIKHYAFDFKDDSEHISCGYISQQLMELNSELVLEAPQGNGSVLYQPIEGKIIPHLSKAIQEQQVIIENQQQTIIEQQEKIDELESRLKRLEDLLLNNNN